MSRMKSSVASEQASEANDDDLNDDGQIGRIRLLYLEQSQRSSVALSTSFNALPNVL